MTVRLTGYFKFSPIKTVTVNFPNKAAAETLLRHEAGQDVYFTRGAMRDAWNAVIGKCAELGWYRNGGWLPNGRASKRCSVKGMGDILGICVTFWDYSSTSIANIGFVRAWIYCDKAFEQAMLEDFFQPDERLKMAVRYTICGSILNMKKIPDSKWLHRFCQNTHDPVQFSTIMFGHPLSDDEIDKLRERCPKLKKFIKLMLVKQPAAG